VNPKLHLLARHLFAQAPCDFVRHSPPPGLAALGHPPPSGEG
jgi:hypothetical protein